MQSRRYTFGEDRHPFRNDFDSMMTDDFEAMRKRFHDRARNMRTDNDFDRWFDHNEESSFQPRFKMPKEDERSSYVRNIPIFSEDDSDRNLMRQGTNTVPKPVPPQTQQHSTTASTPLRSQSPPHQREYHQNVNNVPVPPKNKPTLRTASDSGIDRADSGSPSDISTSSTSDSTSSSSLPRFPSAKKETQPEKNKFVDKEKSIPIKVENVRKDSKDPIPMGFLPKTRDPTEPIPMGYDNRPASAPNGETGSENVSPKVPRATAPPEMDGKTHRVPIIVKPLDTPRSASAPPKRTEPSPPPSTIPSQGPSVKVKSPLERIDDIISEVEKLESRVNAFKGSRADHEYRLLDELLTQAVLKLDVVTTEGLEQVRNARKTAIKRVHDAISLLESKAVERADKKESSGPHRTIIALGGDKDAEAAKQQPKETLIN